MVSKDSLVGLYFKNYKGSSSQRRRKSKVSRGLTREQKAAVKRRKKVRDILSNKDNLMPNYRDKPFKI